MSVQGRPGLARCIGECQQLPHKHQASGHVRIIWFESCARGEVECIYMLIPYPNVIQRYECCSRRGRYVARLLQARLHADPCRTREKVPAFLPTTSAVGWQSLTEGAFWPASSAGAALLGSVLSGRLAPLGDGCVRVQDTTAPLMKRLAPSRTRWTHTPSTHQPVCLYISRSGFCQITLLES